jgi:hypothetical protein
VSPTQQPPQPDSGGPAAAGGAGGRQPDETYRTYREHLEALDPDNPLLKLEPVPGVPPDKATTESLRKEVEAIVQRRVSTFMWPNYPDKSQVRGTRNGAAREVPGGEAQAEKDFAELSKRGTLVDEPYGGNTGFDRRVRLPGTGTTVGIRRNADGVPTLDINSPETRSQKYHYK